MMNKEEMALLQAKLENILIEYFGAKKPVYLRKEVVVCDLVSFLLAFEDVASCGEHIKDYLSFIYRVVRIDGVRLDPNTPALPSLEYDGLAWMGAVLTNFMECKKPLLKTPKRDYVLYNGEKPLMRYLTHKGNSAYQRLTDLLGALDEFFGNNCDFDSSSIIEELDSIRRGE